MAPERDPVDMLDELMGYDDKLTIWESEFLADIDVENLVGNQLDKLEQIYRKYCE